MYEVNTQVIWSWVADNATLAIVLSSACMIEANITVMVMRMRCGGAVVAANAGVGADASVEVGGDATGTADVWVRLDAGVVAGVEGCIAATAGTSVADGAGLTVVAGAPELGAEGPARVDWEVVVDAGSPVVGTAAPELRADAMDGIAATAGACVAGGGGLTVVAGAPDVVAAVGDCSGVSAVVAPGCARATAAGLELTSSLQIR
jgi:hypothetical protein